MPMIKGWRKTGKSTWTHDFNQPNGRKSYHLVSVDRKPNSSKYRLQTPRFTRHFNKKEDALAEARDYMRRFPNG